MGRSTGITLDKANGEPLYRQVFDQVVDRVRSGAFPPGYRLPPTRALAAELATNRNTVVRAYADLESAGFVASTVGRGTFVALGAQAPAATAMPSEGGLPWASIVATHAKAESLRRGQRFLRPVASRDVIN